jgi:hypothetical protein
LPLTDSRAQFFAILVVAFEALARAGFSQPARRHFFVEAIEEKNRRNCGVPLARRTTVTISRPQR